MDTATNNAFFGQVSKVLRYPLLQVGETLFTLWTMLSILFWLLLVVVAKAHPKVLAEPPLDVFFNGFGDSSLGFEVGVWTAEVSSKPRRFRSELYFAIEKKLRENGVEIPFAQRNLHLRTGNLDVAPVPPASMTPPDKSN